MNLSPGLRRLTTALLVGASLTAGCSSGLINVAPAPPAQYQSLGPAKGTACGSLLSPLGGTAYYFLPVLLNSRMERAYQDAVKSVPGATGLVDVTLEETWFWFILGTGRCVTLTGEAVK